MAEIVRNYKCGIVSDTFTIEGMVEKLSSISVSDIDRFKNNSHYAASELCWENEGSKILSIIESW